MKRTIAILFSVAAAIALMAVSRAHAGPVFTYQGLLTANGTPATGPVELIFKFYDATNGGNLLATVDYPGVNLAGGIFTQEIDLGTNLNTVLTGADRWIEITDVTHSVTLPRQHLTWAPYAITANSATTVAANSVTASNIAPGQAVKSLNGLTDSVTLAAGANVAFATNSSTITISATGGGGGGWNLTGNSGTTAGANFLGTTDNQPLQLHVNNSRALRLEPNVNGSPNIIGGGAQNFVTPGISGSTIAGGGSNGLPNSISAQYAYIGGGIGNSVSAGSDYTTLDGGFRNTVLEASPYSTIGGGGSNTIMSSNIASIITGGFHNSVGTNAEAGSIVGGAFNTIGNSSLPIGFVFGATIDGGDHNVVQDGAAGSTIVGGEFNTVQTNATDAVIDGGLENIVTGPTGAIAGGFLNVAGTQAFAAGTQAQANHLGSFVWGDAAGGVFADTSSNQFLIRATGGVAINTNNPNNSALFVNGTVTATHFAGDGSALTNVSATIPPGSINAGQIASNQIIKTLNGLTDAVTLAAGSNVNLAVNSNIITISSTGGGGGGGGSNSGVLSVTATLPLTSTGGQNPVIALTSPIPDALLSNDVVLADGANAFTGSNNFADALVATNASNIFHGAFVGDGSGLTNVSATIPPGSINASQIASNQIIKTLNGLTDAVTLAAGSNVNLVISSNIITISSTGGGEGGGGSNSGVLSVTATLPLTSTGGQNPIIALTNPIPDALLSNDVSLTDGANAFTGSNNFAGVLVATNASNIFHGAFVGDGSGLTGIGGSNSGILSVTATLPLTSTGGQNPIIALTNPIPDALLSNDVALTDGANAFTGSNNFAGALVATNASNIFHGAFVGDGSGLTGIGGSNSGVLSVTATLPLTSTGGQNPVISLSNAIPNTLLAPDVVLEDTSNAFTGSNNFAGVMVATNTSNVFSGIFTGNGSGLTGTGTVTNIATGAGLTGGPITTTGTISIGSASVSNAMLQHPSLTVTAGTGLSGGGSVALGATVTLSVGNVPDTSLSTNIPRLNATNNFFGGTNTFVRVGIATTNPAHLLQVGSSSPAFCDGTTWQNGSDRNIKQGFSAIDPRVILEKVAAMPITEWTYKNPEDVGRHLGPMAQDFHEAFGLNGDDDKHISTVDESGVALAAIQGLNGKMEALRAENERLRQQNEAIAHQLVELRATVKAMQGRN